MGLKDLKSNLDLLGGFGNQGGTLGEMDSFNPSNFQKPTDEASQAHVDSLQEVPGGSQNSPYQDLDGNQGPQFQLPTAQASQKHIDSLTQQSTYTHGDSTEVVGPVPGGDSSSPFQDLDGLQGPQFQQSKDLASQVHESSLSLVPGGSQNSPYQDLDGLANNPSFGDEGGAGKQLGGQDLHVAMLTENYTYPSLGTGETTVNASVHDLNGGLPNSGEYLSNLPD
jgi:hypothetical protein